MGSSELSVSPLVFSGRVGARKAVLRAEAAGLSVEVGDGPQRTVAWEELRALEVRHELRWLGLTPHDGQGPGPMVVLGPAEVPEALLLVRWLQDLGKEVRYSSTPAAYLRNELAIARSEDYARRCLGPRARALPPAEQAPLVHAARQVARWSCAWGLWGPAVLAGFAALAAGYAGLGPFAAIGAALLAMVVLSVLGLQLSQALLPRAAPWLGISEK